MKKIIIGVFIGIAICIISFVIYLNCFMFVPDEGGMENINEIKFGGYTASEWEEMIKNIIMMIIILLQKYIIMNQKYRKKYTIFMYLNQKLYMQEEKEVNV